MNTIPINTPADFECVCCDLLNEFIASYSFENGCLGYVSYHDDVQCLSQKGIDLYERYQLRLLQIGQRLFPGQDMTIKASHLDGPEDYDE